MGKMGRVLAFKNVPEITHTTHGDLTLLSLSKTRLFAGNTHKHLSPKELTKLTWPKTTFQRKNGKEGTVTSNWAFISQHGK